MIVKNQGAVVSKWFPSLKQVLTMHLCASNTLLLANKNTLLAERLIMVEFRDVG
jgi:hypothetical protein